MKSYRSRNIGLQPGEIGPVSWQDEYDEAIRAPLRAEIVRLRSLIRAAYCQGYWEWCGPANDAELERANADEKTGWEKFEAAHVNQQSTTEPI